MKVQVEKASLVQVLQRVQNITEKKTSMPILSNTLIEATGQQMLEISATDLEMSLRTHMGGQVLATGSRTVGARKLLEIVREMPQDLIGLEILPSGRLSIRAGRSHFELATIPAEDYPHLNFFDGVDLVPCDAAALRTCLEKTLYAVPAEDDPFSIAGLFVHPLESGDVRFVASDGHRLAYFQIAGKRLEGLQIGDGVIISRKGVQEILRILEKEMNISIGVYENTMLLKTADTVLTTQLLDAEFPEYELIIPEERPFSLQVEKDQFISALKRMAILTNQKWRHVRLLITAGSMELESGDPEVGRANDVLDIEYEGEDFSVAFNIRYIMEAIQAIEGDKVRFEWVDQFHGGVFIGAEDPGYLTLIMPMVV